MSVVAIPRPKTAIEKRTRTTVDTIMLTPERISKWRLPTGQRPINENTKVRDLADTIKQDGGVVPGILTLGVLGGEYWIIDGQHRLHSFMLSGLHEGFADVRYFHATTMADINREFVELNSKLVNMRPDDFLRGLEGCLPTLLQIRTACPFVGYSSVRRGSNHAPVVSMSATLRNWRGSSGDTPAHATSQSAVALAENLLPEEAEHLIQYLTLAFRAFGREPSYQRLWGALNMVLCMWLFRNLVLRQYSQKSPRLEVRSFERCLMSISADTHYLDWLVGRSMTDRDRSPAYAKVKSIFAKRLELDLGKRVQLPQPAWSVS